MAETKDIVERLFYACVGHPAALIPWPDRLLQDAAAEIARLRAEVAALRDAGAWARDETNRYVIAAAVVCAYEQAPAGSGVDLALAAAGNALVLMLDGQTDPLVAADQANNGLRLTKDHWLIRWQSENGAKLSTTPLPAPPAQEPTP